MKRIVPLVLKGVLIVKKLWMELNALNVQMSINFMTINALDALPLVLDVLKILKIVKLVSWVLSL